MKKSVGRAFGNAFCLALLLTAPLAAQQLATLNVTVTDPAGGVISSARVALRNLETGAKRTMLSSATGVAVLPGLPAGNYQITVDSDQFSPYQAMLTLTVGQTIDFATRMKGIISPPFPPNTSHPPTSCPPHL